MRQNLITALLLLIHLAAGGLACAALLWAFRIRVSLQVMLGIGFPLVVVMLVSVLIMSLAESRRAGRLLRRRQPTPDGGLRLRGLLYAGMGFLLAELFWLRTERDKFVWLGLLFTYALYVAWTWWLPRLRQRTPQGLRRGLDVLGMNVCLSLILAEAALRVTAMIWPTPLLVTSASSEQTRLAASRLTPGSTHYGFRVNSTGHYDHEFVPRSANPQQRVVVSIGDSFSVSRVPHAFHFTTRCEEQLADVAVYNMGISMIGPSEYRYLLAHEALPLHPDLVLINLFIGNDLTDGVFYQGPPRWHDAERYLLPVVLKRLRKVGRERDHLAALDGGPLTAVDAGSADAGSADAGSAGAIEGRTAESTRAELIAAAPELADPLLEKPTFRRSLYLQIERDRAEAVCGSSDYGEFFRRLLELSRVTGIPLAFVLIPDEFQVEDPLWQEILAQSDQPLDRDRPQREIGQWLETQGLDYLDLLPVLRSVAPLPDGRRHVYHLQDSHFNVRGNEVAGRAIAEFVRGKLAQDAELRERFRELPIEIPLDDPAMHRWMLSGWYRNRHATAGDGCWSHGLQSELLLPLPTEGDVRMEFRCQPLAFVNAPPQSVSLSVNGEAISTIPLRPGLQTYSLTLPRDALRDDQNHFVFRYAYARRPSEVLPESQDERLLSVCWYSLTFAQ